MQRIDRPRLEGFDGGVVFEVQTRFDDNAAAIVILQEARANFNRTVELSRGLRSGARVLVAGLAVEYAGEMHHPEMVTIRTGVLAIGRTSLTLGQIARQRGVARLFAEVVLVLADADGPSPIPDAVREVYARQMIPER